jgi:ergothioneine biosynthesis protein EgtB
MPMVSFLSSYQRMRARSRQIFALLADEAYYSRPISLRHPIVFYDGHLPGFSFNTLVKKALGGPSIDPALERLFARGIDPHENSVNGTAAEDHRSRWPDRQSVRRFTDEADRRVTEALARADLYRPGDALLDGAEAAFAILEHEAMHQETLLYMWHRLPLACKRRPHGYAPRAGGAPPRQDWVDVPGGPVTLGVDRGSIPFGWDNEFPACRGTVPTFSIDRHNVTNAAYLEFVNAGGYQESRWWRPEDWQWVQAERVTHPLFWEPRNDGPAEAGHHAPLDVGRAEVGPHKYPDQDGWCWRGMFDLIPLPPAWPVYVSQAEASAYVRWRGARLPTEAEFQRAAFASGDTGAMHPWGSQPPSSERGVFDFSSWDPEPAGSHPAGASVWGVEDLVGNGWEWTSTPFAPFDGFTPMASYPEYSADFFDGEHFVMKGASPVTARDLLRPTFRNWFRARYPYVYASFRCVKST